MVASRIDLVAEWLDVNLFDKATFRDLARTRGAGVIINATDITPGAPTAARRAGISALFERTRAAAMTSQDCEARAVP